MLITILYNIFPIEYYPYQLSMYDFTFIMIAHIHFKLECAITDHWL